MNLAGIAERIEALPEGRRLVALAGPPGAGKSTTARELASRLPSAAILAMDGYHYDDGVLRARGLLPRKGAPETFDVGGLAHMMDRLRECDEDEVAVPVFDRDIEVSRGSAFVIGRDVRIILVEGNWLLLHRAPWSALRDRFDLSVWIDVPMEEIERRLRRRWERYGFDAAAMAAKMDGNDLPNARDAVENSVPADLTLGWDG